MQDQKRDHHRTSKKELTGLQKEKTKLHPRNKHAGRYDFKQLVLTCPELAAHVRLNDYGEESIVFADPDAVKALNKALLMQYYGISYWDIPDGYLCPPIPGRGDYMHHIADLLCASNYGKIPLGEKIRGYDVGVGANCIYPVIGNKEYGWSFIGSDIDPVALDSANKIIELNPSLKGKIELKLQENMRDYFYGVLKKDEHIDFSVCNPPFHASWDEAQSATLRKLKNLNRTANPRFVKNFGGQNRELWCDGGENRFLVKMIRESKKFAASCFWFSSLVSKQSNLKNVYNALKKEEAVEVKTIPMGQGNKVSRIVAWTFLTAQEQKQWKNTRWRQEAKKGNTKDDK